MISITMTEQEADELLEKLVNEGAGTPLANVYNNTLHQRIKDTGLWPHVKKHLISE